MTIQIDLAQLASAIGAIIGCLLSGLWLLGRALIKQYAARAEESMRAHEENESEKYSSIYAAITERFDQAEALRVEGQRRWQSMLDGRLGDVDKWMRQMEREHLQLRAELPMQYVRREDMIREQTVIHAKIDAVAAKIDSLALATTRRTE